MMATQQSDLVKTAHQQWIDLLDKIAVADAEEQARLMPEARRAYWRCRELQGRIIPPRFSEPDGEARDREYAAGKDRP